MRDWLLAGLLAGLAALSKYHAFLFLAGFLGFLLAARARWRTLKEPGLWLAALLTLVLFAPVVIWNASNGWVSLFFQGGRAIPHHFGLGTFASLLAAQIAVLLPGALLPTISSLPGAIRSQDPRQTFLLWLGGPIVLLFTLLPLATDAGMLQWVMPGWLMLLPLGAKYMERQAATSRWPVRWIIGCTILVCLLAVSAAAEIHTGWLGGQFPHLFKHDDPTSDNAEWAALQSAIAPDTGGRLVVTSGWRDASKIDQGLSGKFRVLVASDDPRNFGVSLRPAQFAGQSGWIVMRNPASASARAAMLRCFEKAVWVNALTITRGTRPDAVLTIFRGYDFQPGSCKLVTFSS